MTMCCENWDKCRKWAVDELKEPTEEMVKAGVDILFTGQKEDVVRAVYDAMMKKAGLDVALKKSMEPIPGSETDRLERAGQYQHVIYKTGRVFPG